MTNICKFDPGETLEILIHRKPHQSNVRTRCVTAERCQDIITHSAPAARAHLLHPQVLRPGRAASGAFRSTPALHMIGANACSALRICSTEPRDAHIVIIKTGQEYLIHTHAPVQIFTPHPLQLSRKWVSYFIQSALLK